MRCRHPFLSAPQAFSCIDPWHFHLYHLKGGLIQAQTLLGKGRNSPDGSFIEALQKVPST